jgi:predicted tellurium resistance membrane protein TerC
VWKSVDEFHNSLEGHVESGDGNAAAAATATSGAVIAQIAAIDIVFSLDSVIADVGMVNNLSIMVVAIIIAVGVMLVAAGPIGAFVDRHPMIKMRALSFLILVGVALIGDHWGMHIPKSYIECAMAFSVAVEMLNLRMRAYRKPVELHKVLPKQAGSVSRERSLCLGTAQHVPRAVTDFRDFEQFPVEGPATLLRQ